MCRRDLPQGRDPLKQNATVYALSPRNHKPPIIPALSRKHETARDTHKSPGIPRKHEAPKMPSVAQASCVQSGPQTLSKLDEIDVSCRQGS